MKIAVTGGSGRIGQAIIAQLLARGDTVVSIDRVEAPNKLDGVEWVVGEVTDYDLLARSFAGCDALIHMAAIPSPFRDPDHVVHNNNVVGSYNAMRAAIENGIMRICQASSVNAIGHSYSRKGTFDYFPLDEQHPNHGEDPYALSKWICEVQADTFARRYEDISIASMRFHWVIPDRAIAAELYAKPDEHPDLHLWAYVLLEHTARACLLGIEGKFKGHEAFYIVAPDTAVDTPTMELIAKHFPDVPVRGDLSGHRSLISSAKAERILGWVHPAAAGAA
jgi:nucleoside-diphosphate-sugar epimerase